MNAIFRRPALSILPVDRKPLISLAVALIIATSYGRLELASQRCHATRRDNLAGLMIDDPISDTGLNTAKILARELILFRRTVVVNRI